MIGAAREVAEMSGRSALGRAPHKVAGGLLLVAGATIVMGIITAEALYSAAYDARMEISDLGASETGVVLQPSATIFNATMLAAGAMIIVGAWFAHRALHRRVVTVPTGLLGMGVLGVGVFPGNVHPQHPLFAFTAFVAGGLAVLLSANVAPPTAAGHLRGHGRDLAGVHRGQRVPAGVGTDGPPRPRWGGAVDGLPDPAVAGWLWRLPHGQPYRGSVRGAAPRFGGTCP